MRMRHVLAGAGAALVLGSMAAPAQAAQPSQQETVSIMSIPSWCTGGDEWDEDNYTYGVMCGTSATYYARVKCTNGSSTQYSRGTYATNGGWSYAYCSSLGSGWRKVAYTGTAVRVS
ncbi:MULTISPECIES: hypothetical protein [unclassified Streptomyces]|uniref:hypothetical protein n=1 Tax=unclassified Streptomyces TaxID=2593676 RepID=UPI0033BD5E89